MGANVHVREYATLGRDPLGRGGDALVEPAIASHVHASALIISSAITALNAETRFVRLLPDDDIWFETGPEGTTPTATINQSTIIPANTELTIAVEPGTVIVTTAEAGG